MTPITEKEMECVRDMLEEGVDSGCIYHGEEARAFMDRIMAILEKANR